MRAIGIVASAGGPHALGKLLRALPAGFEVPILVALHAAAGSTAALARSLSGRVPMSVRIAAPGDPLAPAVYLAPDGSDLELDRAGRLYLAKSTGGAHAGDRLLLSVADSCGAGGCAVLLGELAGDGDRGLAAVRDAGGLALRQDDEKPAEHSRGLAAPDRLAALLVEHFGLRP